MRRILLAVLLSTGLLALAGCGNKGPLVRASAHPAAAPMATPAPAATVQSPASARPASAPASTAPAYLSPPMPATAASTGH